MSPRFIRPPERHGLYRREYERDSCGVGFVCSSAHLNDEVKVSEPVGAAGVHRPAAGWHLWVDCGCLTSRQARRVRFPVSLHILITKVRLASPVRSFFRQLPPRPPCQASVRQPSVSGGRYPPSSAGAPEPFDLLDLSNSRCSDFKEQGQFAEQPTDVRVCSARSPAGTASSRCSHRRFPGHTCLPWRQQ